MDTDHNVERETQETPIPNYDGDDVIGRVVLRLTDHACGHRKSDRRLRTVVLRSMGPSPGLSNAFRALRSLGPGHASQRQIGHRVRRFPQIVRRDEPKPWVYLQHWGPSKRFSQF